LHPKKRRTKRKTPIEVSARLAGSAHEPNWKANQAKTTLIGTIRYPYSII